MKVGLIVTAHQSKKFRPMGKDLIDRYLKSLKSWIKHDYTVYFFDNSSEDKFELDEYQMPIDYTYVEDQSLRGNTGPWNDGTINAVNDGCDQIWITNDDVEYNESINDLFDFVKNDEDGDVTVWGVMTNGIDQGNPAYNSNGKLNDGTIDLTNNQNTHVNGFFHGFTKKFYDNFKRKDDNIYDPNPKYNWGGNETTIQERAWKLGGKSKIYRGTWLHHNKIRGWKQHIDNKSWYEEN